MKVNNKENNFYVMPAVICTAGSNIIAVGDKAPASLMGIEIFDHMEPFDIVKFSAHLYADNMAEAFAFPLTGLPDFSLGVAVFKKMFQRRYAVILLTDNEERDRESIRRLCEESGEDEFFSCFARLDAGPVAGSIDVDVIDVVGICEYLTDHGHCPNLYVRTSVRPSESDTIPEIPLNVPRSAFLNIMMLMISSINEICAQRAVHLKICKLNDRLEMRFAFNKPCSDGAVTHIGGLIESCPKCGVYISLLEYICRLYNADIDAFTSADDEKISLVLTFYEDAPELHDFKSCDSLEGIYEDVERIGKLIALITYKEEAQG